jgi:hypothetical protein
MAGQPLRHKVTDRQKALGGGEAVRKRLAQPTDGGQGQAGHRRPAADPAHPLAGAVRMPAGDDGLRAAIQPGDGVVGGRAVFCSGDQRSALAAEGHGQDAPLRGRGALDRAGHADHGLPDRVRIELGPAGARRVQLQRLLSDAQLAARQVEEHGFDYGGANVQTEYRFAHSLLMVPVQWQESAVVSARDAAGL